MLKGVSRICLTCGTRYKPGHPTYCAAHAVGRQNKSGPRPTYKETQRRKQAVLAHVRAYGPWCPGYGVDGHWVSPGDLTADHVIPRSAGGEAGPLKVLCRPCNSRRGNLPVVT